MKFQIHRYISTFFLTFVCLFTLPCALVRAQSQEAVPASAAVGVPTTTAVIQKNGTESATNPYGLAALWNGSDVVARTVLILLLIMSVGSWYILVVKVLEQAKMA